MNDLSTAIRSRLLSVPQVAVITKAIFSDHMPQGFQPPAIVFWTISGDAEDCIDGPTGMEAARVQLECYGSSRAQANALWVEANKALAGFRGVEDGVLIRSVAQGSSHWYGEDRAESGTDQYRYHTKQDLIFWYHVYEV